MAETIRTRDYLVAYSKFSGYTLLAYLGKEANVTVPTTINGEAVAYIGRFAFSPKNPYISDEQRQFLKDSLESVNFTQSHLKTLIEQDRIYPFTFAGCKGLKTPVDTEFLKASDGFRTYALRHIPLFFYPDCPGIFPEKKKSGEDGILKNTEKSFWDYTIAVSGSYHTVAEGVFFHKNATAVYLSEGVERIEAAAFADIPDLQKIYLPSTLRFVAPNAFAHCPSLDEKSKAALSAFITENPLTATLKCIKTKDQHTETKTFSITVSDVTASSDFILLTLAENEATVLLKKTNRILTLPLGEEVEISFTDYDIGSIIEGERYYERETAYRYTFLLTSVQ